MITLKEIKSEILVGKCTTIYYSTGNIVLKHRHEAYMKRYDIPAEAKLKMEQMKKISESGAVQTPLDPTGCTLFEMHNPKKWISGSEEKPTHFGRHGLKAFMLSHHRNSQYSTNESIQWNIFEGWEEYNKIIDKYDKHLILI